MRYGWLYWLRFSGYGLLACFFPYSAFADDVVSPDTRLDVTWVLVAAGLVMMMQVGFLLFEAGMVRSKNSINVAQKNLLDFVFGVVAFAAVGFMIAFGRSDGFIFGIQKDFYFLRHMDSW